MKNDILELSIPKEAIKLRRKAKRVHNMSDPALIILLQKMAIICAREGVAGVAANQLGSSFDVFALSTGKDENGKPKPPVFFFNSKITEHSETSKIQGEGCLSVPDRGGFVSRWEEIKIRWQDKKLKFYEQTFDGFWARAMQHERDHLDGKIYIDLCDETYTEEEMQTKWTEIGEKISVDEMLQAAEKHAKGPLDLLKAK